MQLVRIFTFWISKTLETKETIRPDIPFLKFEIDQPILTATPKDSPDSWTTVHSVRTYPLGDTQASSYHLAIIFSIRQT